jgi:hypothetical protein
MLIRTSIFVLAAIATVATTALVPTSASARVKAGWNISSGVHRPYESHGIRSFYCRKAGGEQ